MKSSDIFELNLKTVWRPVNSRQPNHNRNKSRKIPQSKYEMHAFAVVFKNLSLDNYSLYQPDVDDTCSQTSQN